MQTKNWWVQQRLKHLRVILPFINNNYVNIDVIPCNKRNPTKEHELLMLNKLRIANPHLNWSVKNQARMNL
ncbi:MAG: nucleotidyltransferase family protein, partial [Flavobacteriales bacterium]|nr:nucleotidyltransferase family protein [Flavobacteriales bacterium]